MALLGGLIESIMKPSVLLPKCTIRASRLLHYTGMAGIDVAIMLLLRPWCERLDARCHWWWRRSLALIEWIICF